MVRLLKFTKKSLDYVLKNKDKNYNYLVVDSKNNPTHLVLKNYKTNKKYDNYVIDLNKPILKILSKYMNPKLIIKSGKEYVQEQKFKEDDAIFYNSQKKHYSKIFNEIEKTFDKYYNLSLGVDALRIAYDSWLLYNNPTLSILEKEEISRLNGHSISELGKYSKLKAYEEFFG